LPETTIDDLLDGVMNQLFRRVFGRERRRAAA